MIGGSPLTNEVWRMEGVLKVPRADIYSTRSLYLNYTYHVEWSKISAYGEASWAPRVGFGIFSQYYLDDALG